MRFVLLFALTLISCSNFEPYCEKINSPLDKHVIRIKNNIGYACSAVVIGDRYLLTATHCFDGTWFHNWYLADTRIKIEDGVALDTYNSKDITLLITEEILPHESIEMSNEGCLNPTFVGMKTGTWLTEINYNGTNEDEFVTHGCASPGDSGGGLFCNGKLIGILSEFVKTNGFKRTVFESDHFQSIPISKVKKLMAERTQLPRPKGRGL